MTRSIDDHVALVTGASRGIGRATAVALAEEGCDVALAARSVDQLKETASLCEERGAETAVLETDVADRESVESTVATTVDELGGLEILVNNAGRSYHDPIDRADLDEWESTVDVNLMGTVYTTRHAGPHLREGAENGYRAAVVNIASIAGIMSFGDSSAYCSSKHGVVGMTGSTFEDLRESGVKVSVIEPGFVDTSFVPGDGLDRDKMIQPEDIAETVVFVATYPGTGCPTEIKVRPQKTPYLDGN
ncbi:MAG: SDR family oxidoreductase [Bradymonadaceae bacterium]